MNSILALLAIAAFATASSSHLNFSTWNQFKLAHNKVYSPQEDRLRFKIFSEKLKKIEEHNARFNAGLETYTRGVNYFADMTEEEFKKYLTLSGRKPNFGESLGIHKPNKNFELPESIDYREFGAFNPVRHQGYECGSCWAFATVAALESVNYLHNGVLLSLSEQNLVDCDKKSHGCKGGLPSHAYDYIKNNGLETQHDYPYKGIDGACQYDPSKSVITVSGYKTTLSGSEDDLKSAVGEVGPVTVGVDFSDLDDYTGGIFFSKKTNYDLNHAIVVVGYGSENGQDYWIARNSWGEEWGEQGYIRLARNAGNQIGISDDVVYPVL